MRDLWQDIRYALRSLRARPSYTFTAVLTLALGLGVTTAVASVVYTVVLAPPPYPDHEALVQIARVRDGRRVSMVPAADVAAIRETPPPAFTEIGVATFRDVAVSGSGAPERVRGVLVTGATLPMLGVAPALGRLPDASDDTPGGPCVVVLSHRVWTEHFGARGDIVGDAARLDGAPCSVAAVMPPDFAYPNPYFAPGDVWLLAGPAGLDWTTPRDGWFLTFARLTPGADLETAATELDVIAGRLAAERDEPDVRFAAMRWAATSRESSRPQLLTLLVAAGLVLVVGCINVVNLQLARNVDRRAEIATRMALGASRGRLVRHVVAESALLFGAGGAAGLLVATWSLQLILSLRSYWVSRMEEASIDLLSVGVCLGLALVAGLLAAVLPALRLSDVGAATTLRQVGRGVVGPRGRRFGRGLVAVEAALALVLLAGTGILFQSYRQAATADPGFRVQNLLHARVTPPEATYPDAAARTAFFEIVRERIAGLPGVVDVALAYVPPGLGAGADQPFALAGGTPAGDGSWPRTVWRSVSHGYFTTLGIPLVRGDDLAARRATARVAVVNEQFVRQFLRDREALGERLYLVPSPRADQPGDEAFTIVGIVADAREGYVHQPAPPAVYVRHADRPVGTMAILTRTAGPPLAMAGALREAVASIDPDLPVFAIRDLEHIIVSDLDLNRLGMVLLALFAGVSLVLAVAGIYGVIAHAVGQRVREMGVRIALGALPADVLRLIVGDCARYLAAGAAAGLILAVVLAGRLEGLTRSWAGTDARLLAVAALVVSAVGVVAAWVPARRAASVDPAVALRQE